MALNDWYLSSAVTAARDEVIASHLRLREAQSGGDEAAGVAAAVEQSLTADSAYYALIARHLHETGAADEDPEWTAIDAATSQIEGFTAGDPD